jgi:hypothetical protein
MSHDMIPIIIPPTTHGDMKAVLTGIHAYGIDSDTNLSEFRDQLISKLRLKHLPTARRDVKRRKFLEELPAIVKMIEPPKTVKYIEYEALKNKYEESLAELKSADDEREKLQDELRKVKALKDREEIKSVEREFSDDWDIFEGLCDKAKSLSDQLPSMATEAIYHEMTDKDAVPKGEHILDEISSAVQDGFLIDVDDRISVNRGDPKARRYVDATEEVSHFLSIRPDDVEGGFFDQCADKYDYQAEFGSRRLWESHLGLTAYTKWT